jgi:methylmalonyl-CoA/ethylmalonyl-CoA epimerase
MNVLDHLAIATDRLADGWELFGAVLGANWVYGGGSGFWFGQVRFAAGPKIEMLTPTGGPGSAFLERFLAAHGPAPHHFNFHTEDIEGTLERVRSLGIEPVGVSLAGPGWKEFFLHPRTAHGFVIQVAQEDNERPSPPPADYPEPGPRSDFDLIEYHVSDLPGATRLYAEVLDGQVTARSADAVELSWPGAGVLRLVRPPAGTAPLPRGGALQRVRFARPGGAFSAAETGRAVELGRRLGLTVELAGTSRGA